MKRTISYMASFLHSKKAYSFSSASSNNNTDSTCIKQTFGQYAYTPKISQGQKLTPERLDVIAKDIFEWAKSKGVSHYSFVSYPHTSSISQKQENFLNIKFNSQITNIETFKQLISEEFSGKTLIKGEGDGSSFPNGGLRVTHEARAYTIWDPLSQIYINKSNKVLYIPSVMVSHHGHALDDKTLFRASEKVLKSSSTKLLSQLGIKAKSIKLLLGLEQQFFAIPMKSYEKRQDLQNLGRALIGNVPHRNQQLGEHYYGKVPSIINKALKEVERELLGIGIPIKTKHNEVALNQFQMSPICTDAGHSLDQNLITVQILKEVFERHDLKVLFHEKPFRDINGSGKHANWSLNYIRQDETIKNLFTLSDKATEMDLKVYKLFILMNLNAVLKNHKLFLSAIASTGNEIRLGGHEAPPRIISVFLGKALANILDDKRAESPRNLREILDFLNFDVLQQNTDRNRTSPYAYTGNRFQFRAVGSSQNPFYAVSVIAATMAKEILAVSESLNKGQSLDSIIAELTEKTRPIRFQGDGYSQQWKKEAIKRGLYVNENFCQIYSFMEAEQSIFQELKISSKEQIKAKTNSVQTQYKQTVLRELNTLLLMLQKHVIPQGFRYLQTFVNPINSTLIQREITTISASFEEVLKITNRLRILQSQTVQTLQDYQKVRNQIEESSVKINQFIKKLPSDNRFPDLHEFLKL